MMHPFLKKYLVLIGIAYCSTSFAQFNFTRWNALPVQEQGKPLINAWTGGLNAPQFSTIDLNTDGIKDLVVFDRVSNQILTFLNGGTANTIDYTYHPEYESRFPDMRSWCLMRDYDGDGKEDIFTSIPGGIAVYRNTTGNGQPLSFQLISNDLQAQYSSFVSSVYVGSLDIPSIVDADGDGDLDILTFELSTGNGDGMYFFKNRSKELHGHQDSLTYTLHQTCWGKFREDPNTCDVLLNACNGKPTPDTGKAKRVNLHSGSTVLAFDATGEGLLDLLIGDIGCSSMYLLSNTGTQADAHISSITLNFPTEQPIKMDVFPAAFSLDINNDGKKDLIIAPNIANAAENFNNCRLYLNTGSLAAPQFTFQNSPFLVNTMLDFGEGCYPSVMDLDADGLKDILVGNYGYYVTGGNYAGKLAFMRNTGSLAAPAFDLQTRDYGNFSSLNLNGLFTSFGDLDQDGDQDMVLGEREGSINLFYNEAGTGNPAVYTAANGLLKYQNIDVSSFSTPILFDLNKDGQLDIITGKKNAFLNYYQNTASNPPIYSLQNDTLGKIKLETPSMVPNGYMSAWLGDFDKNGSTVLLCTKSNGTINRFDQIDGNISGNYLATGVFNPKMGNRISFTVNDLDNNGKNELIVGSYRGGMAIFTQIDDVFIQEQTASIFKVYPNPAQTELYIHLPDYQKPILVQLFDISGRMLVEKMINHAVSSLSVADLSPGLYFINIGNSTQKVFVQEP